MESIKSETLKLGKEAINFGEYQKELELIINERRLVQLFAVFYQKIAKHLENWQK